MKRPTNPPSAGPRRAPLGAAENLRLNLERMARAIAEGRHSEGPPLTVCSGCREWKVTYHVLGIGGGSGVAGRQELCKECGTARGLHVGPPPPKKPIPAGNFPAPPHAACACGHAAAFECQGCKRSFCEPCWWRHSHTTTIRYSKR